MNTLHKLDYFVAASQVSGLPDDRISNILLSFVSASYHWEAYQANGQKKWRLASQ